MELKPEGLDEAGKLMIDHEGWAKKFAREPQRSALRRWLFSRKEQSTLYTSTPEIKQHIDSVGAPLPEDVRLLAELRRRVPNRILDRAREHGPHFSPDDQKHFAWLLTEPE